MGKRFYSIASSLLAHWLWSKISTILALLAPALDCCKGTTQSNHPFPHSLARIELSAGKMTSPWRDFDLFQAATSFAAPAPPPPAFGGSLTSRRSSLIFHLPAKLLAARPAHLWRRLRCAIQYQAHNSIYIYSNASAQAELLSLALSLRPNLLIELPLGFRCHQIWLAVGVVVVVVSVS